MGHEMSAEMLNLDNFLLYPWTLGVKPLTPCDPKPPCMCHQLQPPIQQVNIKAFLSLTLHMHTVTYWYLEVKILSSWVRTIDMYFFKGGRGHTQLAWVLLLTLFSSVTPSDVRAPYVILGIEMVSAVYKVRALPHVLNFWPECLYFGILTDSAWESKFSAASFPYNRSSIKFSLSSASTSSKLPKAKSSSDKSQRYS